MIQQQTKRCTACGEWKPLDAFSRLSRARDGLRPRCRECVAASDKRYYAENREKRIAAAVAWHRAHPEVQRAAMRRFCKAHPDRVADTRRKFYERRLCADPEGMRAYWREAYRRRRARQIAEQGAREEERRKAWRLDGRAV